MNHRILDLLLELDRRLEVWRVDHAIELYYLGRSALVSQYGAPMTTRDVDFMRPHIDEWLIQQIEATFGKNTEVANRLGVYLEFVNEALPPVPVGSEIRASLVIGPWQRLRVYSLDPHDLAATKMRRFSPHDREDIRFLSDQGLIEPEQLTNSLEKAFLNTHPKDGDPFRDGAFDNLAIVQRYLRWEIREF